MRFSKQAEPKSMTLMSPESRPFSRTFSGLRSQWMMLDSHSTLSASRICTAARERPVRDGHGTGVAMIARRRPFRVLTVQVRAYREVGPRLFQSQARACLLTEDRPCCTVSMQHSSWQLSPGTWQPSDSACAMR